MQLSTYQQSILSAILLDRIPVENPKGVLIEALAGTGKSFILIEICKMLQDANFSSEAVKLVVFGKKNKADLADRLEKKLGGGWGNCVSTLHSLSFQILKDAFAGVPSSAWKVEGSKYQKIAAKFQLVSGKDLTGQKIQGTLWVNFFKKVSYYKECSANELQQRADELDADFLRLIDLLRLYCYEATTENINILIDAHGLSDEMILPEAVEGARKVLNYGLEMIPNFWIDYTDMSWAVWMERNRIQPILEKWRNKLKLVAVDEAQDTDILQINVLSLLIDPEKSFLIAVGDRRQAVYAFRGCVANGLDRFKEKFNCESFLLPVNYRCGFSHLELVRKFDQSIPIEPAPNAIKGEIRVCKPDQFLSLFDDENLSYMGVSRKNAPLIIAAIKLLGDGKPCKIKDKSLGKKVVDQVQKICRRLNKKYQADIFPKMLSEFEVLERERLLKYPDGEQKVSELADLLAAIAALFENYEPVTIKDWEVVIDKIFDDNSQAPINLYSIHSGKGGEADVSFILSADQMPLSHKKMTAAEREQEKNLIYVALTRPRKTLAIFCEKFPTWLPSEHCQWWSGGDKPINVEELSIEEKKQAIWIERGFGDEIQYDDFDFAGECLDDEFHGWKMYLDAPNEGITSVDLVGEGNRGRSRYTELDFDPADNSTAENILGFCRDTIRLIEAAEIPDGQLSLPLDQPTDDFLVLLETVAELPIAKQATILREIGDRLGNDVVMSILS
jgi:superfamily I DNA/RNA helicase